MPLTPFPDMNRVVDQPWDTRLIAQYITAMKNDIIALDAASSASLYINVKAYGAKGDGTTDDSVAIANATTAAVNATFAGIGTALWFPTGKYWYGPAFGTPWTCTLPGVSFIGEGQTGVNVGGSGDLAGGDVQIIVNDGYWGLTLGVNNAVSEFRGYRVEGLHFYEKNAGQGLGGLRIFSSSNGTYRDVAAGAFTAGTGILVDGHDSGTQAQYNTFENCRTGDCLIGYDQRFANGTRWIGGYLDGNHNIAGVRNTSIGMKLESGDTFRSHGTVIQGYDKLIQLGANYNPEFYGVRLENFKTNAIEITGGTTDACFYGGSDNSINSNLGTGITINSAAVGTVVGIDFRNCATAITDNGSGTRTPLAVASTLSNFLGADQTISVTNSYTDGPSITLTPGTWYVSGKVALLGATSAARLFTARLWDGTTDYATDTFEVTGSAAAGQASIRLEAFVTVAAGATKTMKISATSDTGTADKIKTTAGPTANKASYLNATKL